jgi:hypothetical protein
VSSGCPLPRAEASRFTSDETIRAHRRYVIAGTAKATVVTWLPLVVVTVGLPLLGLLAELALLDTRPSQAVAGAAVRRAMEPLDPSPSRSPPVG